MPKTVAVIGAGTMGAGIAQVAALNGWRVYLVDVSPQVVQAGLAGIGRQLDRMVEKSKLDADERRAIGERLTPRERIENLHDVDLAIEAVVERLDVKHEVFKALGASAPGGAVLATNTSSLSVGRIAEAAADPARVVGMHFFNPAPLMPLVEIIAPAAARPEAVAAAVAAARAWGKTTVRAQDTPGFIVNRVARGYYLEALRMLGEGVAGVDEIDAALREHGGFKMGPFELMDLVGLDVNYAVSHSVWEQMGRPPRFTPHEIQRQLVENGRLGRKSGVGFYNYGGQNPLPAYLAERRDVEWSEELGWAVAEFTAAAGAASADRRHSYILARILSTVINEAALAFDEGVASAEDINTAMKLGTNYPKGPLEWAAAIGPGAVRRMLAALNQAAGDGRFAPARFLGDQAD